MAPDVRSIPIPEEQAFVPAKESVLAVEDEPRYQRLLCGALESRGYKTLSSLTGNDAIQIVAESELSLLLLDLGLPDIDGLRVIEQIREFSDIPIVIVTARADESDIVRGLEIGADDYLTKPFGISELAARVKAALRRSTKSEHPVVAATFENGPLKIDYRGAEITMGGDPVKPTGLEYRLIRYFSQNVGRVLTPDQIPEEVWGPEYVGDEHLVRVYVSRVRKKIEWQPGDPRLVQTRAGIGYLMVKQ